MDFSKLNIEFSNMQKTVSKYTEIVLKINNKIKENLKVISITSLKNENKFLESIINNEEVSANEKKVL